MCEFVDECEAPNEIVVNSRFREAQTMACGAHVGGAVFYMLRFNDIRYARRASDYGVRVWPTEHLTRGNREPEI